MSTWVAREWRVGDRIAELYEIRDVVRSGGMGLVYRARHLTWEVDLAVKVPRPELVDSVDGIARFTDEAETWVGLGLHPHTVYCAYVRALDGLPAVFAEWVDGGDLATAVASGRLYAGGTEAGLARILDAAIQCAWGLEHAHGRGLVHQDVKPANVMLATDGLAKVTDFGLAHAREAAGESPAGPGDRSVLAGYGGMTPAYCSPEQAAAARRPDVRLSRATDVWSWAVTVLEMFTGGPPCRFGQTAGDILAAFLVAGGPGPPIPPLPDPVARLLARCFVDDPAERPRDLGALADELTTHYRELVGRPYPRPRPDAVARRADELCNQALSMLDLGRAERAEQLWEQALACDAWHPETVVNQRLHRWRTGRITDEKMLADVEGIRTATPFVDGRLVLLHLERGDPASAAALLDDEDIHVSPVVRAVIDRLRRPEPTPLPGGPGGATAVALNASGNVAVAGGTDRTVRVWDTESGTCRHELMGHGLDVTAAAVSVDGSTVVSGDRAGWVRVWDLRAGPRTAFGVGRPLPVDAVAVSPDGRYALAGWTDGVVQAWDVLAGRGVVVPVDEPATVIDRAMEPAPTVAPTGRWVAVATDGRVAACWRRATGQLLVWDVASGASRYAIRRQHAPVVFAADASVVVAEHADGTVARFDLASGRLLGQAPRHPAWSGPVAAARASVALVGDGRASTFTVSELDTGRCRLTLPAASLRGLAVCADGRTGLVGGPALDPTVIHIPAPGVASPWWYCRPRDAAQLTADKAAADAALAEVDRQLAGGRPSAAAQAIRAARDVPGHRNDAALLQRWRAAVTAGRRTALHAIRLARRLSADEGRPVAICAETGVAVCARDDGRLAVVDLVSAGSAAHLPGHSAPVRAAVLVDSGRYLLTADDQGTIGWWSLPDRRCLARFAGPAGQVVALAASADGRVGLAGTHGPGVRVLDLGSGREHTIDTGAGWIHALAVSPDATSAITVAREVGRRSRVPGARVWRLTDRAAGHLLDGPSDRFGDVEDVAVSPDGRLVVCDHHGEAGVWDIRTGRRRALLTDCRGPLRIGPDSRHAVSGNTGHGITVWDLVRGYPVHTVAGHGGALTAVAISADSRFAATTATDRALEIWDLTAGTLLTANTGHTRTPIRVDISADGHRVASASDSELCVWELDWDYEFPPAADRAPEVRPYLAALRARRGERPGAGELCAAAARAGFGWLSERGLAGEWAATVSATKPRRRPWHLVVSDRRT